MINEKTFAAEKNFFRVVEIGGTTPATIRDWLSMPNADECKQDM
jgi:hypothetical protein